MSSLHLLKYEVLKLVTNKIVVLIIGILCIANIMLLQYDIGTVNTKYSGYAYKTITSYMAGMNMLEKGTFLTAEMERIEALYHIDSVIVTEAETGQFQKDARDHYQKDFDEYFDGYLSRDYLRYCDTINQEYFFITQILTEYQTVSNHFSYVETLEKRTDSVGQISIFQGTNAEYNTENAQRTAEKYSHFDNFEIDFMPQRGVVLVLSYATTDFLFLCAVFLLAYAISRSEKDNSILDYVRTTFAGRFSTALAKIYCMFLSLICLVVLFYGVNFLYSALIFGFRNHNLPVQAYALLVRCPYHLSIKSYFGIYLLCKWFSAIVMGLWIMIIGILANAIVTSFSVSAIYMALSIYFRISIHQARNYVALNKYFNLLSLFFPNDTIAEYRNVDLWGTAVEQIHLETISLIVHIVALVTSFCLVFARFRLKRKGGVKVKHRTHFSHHYYPSSLIAYESYKFLFLNAGLAIIIGTFIVNLSIVGNTKLGISGDELLYRGYIKDYQGVWTVESYRKMITESERFHPLVQLEQARNNGTLTDLQYRRMKETYGTLEIEQRAFNRLTEYIRYINQTGNIEIVYDTGYARFFGISSNWNKEDTIICCILIILLMSGSFSIEIKAQMISLLVTTTNGVKRSFKTKMLILFMASTFIALCNTIIRLIIVCNGYGISSLLAPSASISALKHYGGLPLFIFIFLHFLCRILATYCVGLITCWLSLQTGNQMSTTLIAGSIFSIPILLSYTRLSDFVWLGVYPLFSSSMILYTGTHPMFVGFYIALVSILILLVRFKLLEKFGRISQK